MNLSAVLQPPFEVLVLNFLKRNNNHLYTKDGPGKINVCFTVFLHNDVIVLSFCGVPLLSQPACPFL